MTASMIIGFAGLSVLLAMTPGPDTFLVLRLSLQNSRSGLAAAMGSALGSLLWAFAVAVGLASLLEQSATAYRIVKIAGGLYLIYLAVMIWRRAPAAIEIGTHSKRGAPLAVLRNGFLIQIANPKVVVFFGSIFFALLPPHAPLWVSCVAVLIVFINEAGWYALVSLLFSSSGPRGVYMRMKPSFDRVMAGVLGMIGMKLIADTR